MKSLAIICLIAVPRGALELLAGKFHGWRRLLRAALAALLYAAIVAAFGLLSLVLLFGGNS